MKHFNQIDRYLNHEMTEVERLTFEQMLEQDNELAKEFLIHKTEHEALQIAAFSELHAHIYTKDTLDQSVKKPLFTTKNIFKIAASLVLLATIGYFFTRQKESTLIHTIDKEQAISRPLQTDTSFQTQKQPSAPLTPKPAIAPVKYQQLAIAMLTQESNSIAIRSKSTQSNNSEAYLLWEKAFTFFQQEQYDSLYRLADQIPNEFKYAADIRFLQAHALLNSQQFESAYAHILSLQETNENVFQQERNDYFLLLAGIGRFPKGRKKTLQLLNTIASDSGHTYFPKAKEIKTHFR